MERDPAVDAYNSGLDGRERHLAFHLKRVDVMAAHRDRLEDHSVGKGCIRFPEQTPSDLEPVGDLVDAVGAGSGPVC